MSGCPRGRPECDGPAPRLVLATHNKGKLRELRELLRGQVPGLDVDTQVVDAAAAGAPDVVETGVTFAENSLLKARAVAEATGLVAIADDSGLGSGRPGRGTGDLFRTVGRPARRRCRQPQAPAGPALRRAGRAPRRGVRLRRRAGRSLRARQRPGSRGVRPARRHPAARAPGRGRLRLRSRPAAVGEDRSCAELLPEEKNAISHRGQAFRALLPAIVDALARQ